MRNIDKEWVGYWLKRYLQEYMPIIRNYSRNTITSYRDAIHQLMEYIILKGKSLDTLTIEDLSETLITDFLLHLEIDKHCSIRTRNQRLAAIHSFAEFVATSDSQYIYWLHKLKSIPLKRGISKEGRGKVVPKVIYLEKNEIKALLSAPDKKTQQGARDYALMMFLYNSGARASEAANLTIKNLEIEAPGQLPRVTINGKGSKIRVCPLWDSTVSLLLPFINRPKTENVFLNRFGAPITRFGIYEMVNRYAEIASKETKSLIEKKISPHTIRHSTASHLLEAGVDINTIRAWLGHVSVNTTNIYAEVNIKMKAEALKTCEISNFKRKRSWQEDKSLLAFLKTI
jgi:integrase/recombinase XerD